MAALLPSTQTLGRLSMRSPQVRTLSASTKLVSRTAANPADLTAAGPAETRHRRLARADAELSIGFLLIGSDLREAKIRPEAARQRETIRRVAHGCRISSGLARRRARLAVPDKIQRRQRVDGGMISPGAFDVSGDESMLPDDTSMPRPAVPRTGRVVD